MLAHQSTALRGQASQMSAALVDVLTDTQVSEIDTLIAGVGPGSFTGIRICLATALGLVSGAGDETPKLACVDAFSVQYAAFVRAYPEMAGQSTMVVVESKRPDLFAQIYDKMGQPAGDAFLVRLEQIQDSPVTIVTGDAVRPDWRIVDKNIAVIDVRTCDYFNAHETNLKTGRNVDAKPFYLRPPDVGPTKPQTL